MMKKYILAWAAICLLFPAFATANEYPHKLEAKNMTVFWRIDKEQIHVKLTAKTTGWVAIGFDPEKAMQGADIIIGAVKKGKVKIEDHYADRKRVIPRIKSWEERTMCSTRQEKKPTASPRFLFPGLLTPVINGTNPLLPKGPAG